MSHGITAICIPVSPGEFLDRLAIATVRCDHIREGRAQQAAKDRQDVLEHLRRTCLPFDSKLRNLFNTLVSVNRQLWKLEDKIRQVRDVPEERAEFVLTAYQIFSENDRRAAVKQQIDSTYAANGETKVYQTSTLVRGGSRE